MYRLSAPLAFAFLLLYGAGCVLATRAASASASEPGAAVALVLPLESPSFARHADAVKQGFAAAAKVEGKGAPAIRIYATDDQPPRVIAAYQRAVADGASIIVGPLTRDAVSALAASGLVSVPTLALNTADTLATRPARLYEVGLAIEPEARNVALFARSNGRRAAVVIVDDTPLSKRMRQAFADDFEARGGTVVAEVAYQRDALDWRDWKNAAAADMVFLAVDAAKARSLRPYLPAALEVYATSQVNAAPRDPLAAHDLNGVRFVDMPWFVEPDHPAVMIYPRPAALTADVERLYALGIDAFRVALWLLVPSPDASIDGVTGRLRLGPGQRFTREPVAAQFVDGTVVLLGAPRR